VVPKAPPFSQNVSRVRNMPIQTQMGVHKNSRSGELEMVLQMVSVSGEAHCRTPAKGQGRLRP
jgi:hypothetical protein